MLKIFFDGGCRPNPGAIEVAVVARGELHLRTALGSGSSERAEWLALLAAIDVARQIEARDIILLGDCAGVIAQANGDARGRSPDAIECARVVANQCRLFDRLRVRHIKRTQNLAGIALDRLRQAPAARR